ncbi:unnamed protein product [Heligmosomoides polygyrus]|uniref:40S ribosomal protein S19-binding protein 1 n=1 Tax=Heligmosomoides polygyrus TaxID=6339 RepID=A0A183GJZ7_HELPZ|nr:unnamed protein product [Heligmosomoides polygyrus]
MLPLRLAVIDGQVSRGTPSPDAAAGRSSVPRKSPVQWNSMKNSAAACAQELARGQKKVRHRDTQFKPEIEKFLGRKY